MGKNIALNFHNSQDSNSNANMDITKKNRLRPTEEIGAIKGK